MRGVIQATLLDVEQDLDLPVLEYGTAHVAAQQVLN
jgi:hypothetical protein